MKKSLLIVFIILIWAVGLSKSLPPLNPFGKPFKPKDLKIEWDVKSNSLPSKVWVYDLLPNHFSPEFISNLVTICGLSLTNKSFDGTNGMDFSLPDKSKFLGLSYPLAMFDFQTKAKAYKQMSRAGGAPNKKEAQTLTLKYLAELGISPDDLEKNETNSEPRLMYLTSHTSWLTNGAVQTNIYRCKVVFRRGIDGIGFVGIDNGGSGNIEYGANGEVREFRLSWADAKRDKQYDSLSPEVLMQMIKDGKAVQGAIIQSELPIDWNKVKLLKINKASYFYCSGRPNEDRTDKLMPVVALWTTIVSDERSIDVEIDCPFDNGQISPMP